MKLETKRLILRDYKMSDLKDLVKNINNIKISRYLLVVPYPYSKKDGILWIKKCQKNSKKGKKKDSYDFAIELKSERRVIGTIGISKIDYYQGKAMLGYWIGKKYWRQGIISEALAEVLKFSFKKLKLRRLEAGIFAENKPSYSLLQKFGFKKEGIERKSYKCKATGKIHDNWVYALLKEEYKK